MIFHPQFTALVVGLENLSSSNPVHYNRLPWPRHASPCMFSYCAPKKWILNAPPASEISADRPDRFGGANPCADCRILGCQPSARRSAAGGRDLFDRCGLGRRPVRSIRPASHPPWCLFHMLRGQCRRFRRYATATGRDTLSPVRARGLARSCPRPARLPNRV